MSLPKIDLRDRGPVSAARVTEVIVVTACGGRGTVEDPHRIITSYFSKSGEALAVHDPMRDGGVVRWTEDADPKPL